jgi:hypothetical protein
LDFGHFSSLDDFPYYLLWKNRGVQFVSDLINHENKQFYSFEQILSVGFWTILSIRLLYRNLAFLLDTIFFTKVSVVSCVSK